MPLRYPCGGIDMLFPITGRAHENIAIMKLMRWRHRGAGLAAFAAAGLAACAAAPSGPATPVPAAEVPPQWHAPLPRDGSTQQLAQWWKQFDDPLVPSLIDAAEAASPNLATARSRIAQADAQRVAATGALLPTVDANAAAERGRQDFITPTGTLLSAGVRASWEIDLFGAARAGRQAAVARSDEARAGWHAARVSVAAELATNYVGLRACEAVLDEVKTDAASREQTARLTALSRHAGFQSPANEALSRASAAQARAQVSQQQAQCDLDVKALVAMTGLPEDDLRRRLAARRATLPRPAQLQVAEVPGSVLAQRPDVYMAERELAAASADVAQARARRLPQVSVAGTLTAARFESGGLSANGTLWTIGPLSVSLPLFDAGVRRANVDAAKARYDEAASKYRAALRDAVREVEQALVVLDSTTRRSDDARVAAEGFDESYRAAQARYRGGLASLFELEDARRSAVQAHSQLIELQRAQVTAWINLYRALGGGWDSPQHSASAAAASATP